MPAEVSYGVVPLHKQGTFEWRVLLVHHTQGHWGFPKGHAEEGEEPRVTAERELLEETGLQVVRFLPFEGLTEHYKKGDLDKEVTYFLAEAEGHVVPQPDEIETAEWFPFETAKKRLTFPEGRDLCRKVEALLETIKPKI